MAVVEVQVPTAPRAGLTSAEAEELLRRTGPNEVGAASRTWLHLLSGQLRSPLLGLLFVAAAVSVAVGERVDGGVILAIMALSVGLGFLNEFRSERTVDALRRRTGRRATVIRDGSRREIPATDVVPGDLCALQIGDVVPADLRLVEPSGTTAARSTCWCTWASGCTSRTEPHGSSRPSSSAHRRAKSSLTGCPVLSAIPSSSCGGMPVSA